MIESLRRGGAVRALALVALVAGGPALWAAGQQKADSPRARDRRPAPAAASPAASETPHVPFEKVVLPNGLQLILHVDRKLPIVHVNQWYHVGSKNETRGRTGFAHLFEHMMFQGSKNVPGEYFDHVERIGANLFEGGVNGTTSADRTNYFATVPSANLESLLWVESDRLATLLEVTTQEKLDNQRDVVKNERRQGLENQPYGRWFWILSEALHPAGHPYSWSTIGSQEDLSAATLEDVKAFFARYYTPNNLSLVIAGDFDPAEAKRLVEKYFGPIPPGPPLDRPARDIPRLDGEKIIEVADRVPQERTYMAWVAPEYFGPDDAALTLAARILSDGLSSRLNRALVYDRQLCSDVAAFPIAREIAGAFVVQLTARPGASLEKIEAVATDEIAKLAKTGPTQAELDRARTKHEFEFVSGLERIGGFGGKADLLNQYNTFLGDPDGFARDLARYRALTPEAVRAAVDRWLNTRNRVLIRFHPESSTRPETTTLDRSKAPPLGEDRPFTAPTVETGKLDNGLEVFVVTRSDLPKVAVTLVTRAGAIRDPEGRSGTAMLTAQTLDMGTTSRKALEIESALGDLGTSLGESVGREGASLSLEVLRRNLEPAVAIMADVAMHPTFPAAEVDREKKRHLDMIAQQEKNPNALAARIRQMIAFGASHAYGRPVSGLRSTVEPITREDLARFHREYWRPASSALVFVGPLSRDEAIAIAREHFGGWTGAAAPDVAIPPPSPSPAGTFYIVDRQDSAQTVVTQVMPAPPRHVEDRYALRLVDAVWGGGGFGTRLNLNLREDKGYSYGVFSTLAQFQHGGLWFAGGGVQTDKTREAVAEFVRELKALAGDRPITEEEFNAARLRRLRGYAQQFEAYGRVAQQIADLWIDRLPPAELQREYDATASLTLDAVLAATKTYVHPDRASIVLVGDRGRIEPGLRELKLADVVVLDVEGRPVGAPPAPSSQQ